MLSRLLGTHMCRSGLEAASCCSARSPALRVATQRTSSLCGGATAAAAMLVHAKRYVQFEQTGETMVGINKKKRAMNSRWVTKSTKEYMGEADSKVMKGNSLLFSARDGRRDDMARRKQRTRAVAEETDRIFDLEVDRMREDTGRRWKKVFSFLRRQGKAFTLLYIAAYVVPLAALYIGFATGVLPKDAVFEFLFFFLQKFMVREQFFERVEAWDTYTNFGFAFVVNEMLEVVRFPVVMFFFYQARPFLTGVNQRVKASIFRFNAAES